MSAEKNRVILDHSVEMTVPSRCEDCDAIMSPGYRDPFRDQVETFFTEWFGGFQTFAGRGGYKLRHGPRAGTRVPEGIDVVHSACSSEQLEEHREHCECLAVWLANALSQETVSLEIDGRMAYYDRSKGTLKCMHKQPEVPTVPDFETAPVGRPPRPGPEKVMALRAACGSLSTVEDARYIFSELLKHDPADAHVPTQGWPRELVDKLVAPPQIVCDTRGFRIVYLRLNHRRLLRTWERELITRIMRDIGAPRYGMFIFSNEAQGQWGLVGVKDTFNGSVFRRIRISRGRGALAAATRLVHVDLAERAAAPAEEIQRLCDNAFDVVEVRDE